MSMITMGLNQKTLEELNQSSAITDPAEMNAGGGTVVVVNTDTDTTDELGKEVMADFSDFDIVIETQEGLEGERVRLEDVAQSIMAAETISYTDVQSFMKTIDMGIGETETGRIVASGIAQRLDEVVPLDSFTDTASTVNLKETQKFIKKEVRLNAEKFNQLYTDFFTNKAEDFLKRAEFLSAAMEKEIGLLNTFTACCLNMLKTSTESKNYLAYLVVEEGEPGKRSRTSRLYDIRHTPLDAYMFRDVVEYGFGIDESMFAALANFFHHGDGLSLSTTVQRSSGYELSTSSPYYRTVMDMIPNTPGGSDACKPSYHELLSFFATNGAGVKLFSMQQYLSQQMEFVKALRVACIENKPCSVDGREFGFHEAIERVVKLCGSCAEALKFLTAVETARQLSTPVFEVMDTVLSTN